MSKVTVTTSSRTYYVCDLTGKEIAGEPAWMCTQGYYCASREGIDLLPPELHGSLYQLCTNSAGTKKLLAGEEVWFHQGNGDDSWRWHFFDRRRPWSGGDDDEQPGEDAGLQERLDHAAQYCRDGHKLMIFKGGKCLGTWRVRIHALRCCEGAEGAGS